MAGPVMVALATVDGHGLSTVLRGIDDVLASNLDRTDKAARQGFGIVRGCLDRP
jgi:hypothetical protein